MSLQDFNREIEDKMREGLQAQAQNTKAPEAPTVNPEYQKILDKQKQLASDYRKNLPQYSTALGNQYEAGARQNLASGLRQTDQDFNRRGLLYSSARVGQQAGQQAQSAADISSGKQKINQGLLDNANKMDAGVFATGMGIAGGDTQAYNFQQQSDIMSMKNDLYNELRNSQAVGSFAGGLGGLAGLGLGQINFSPSSSLSTTESRYNENSGYAGSGAAAGVLQGYYNGLGINPNGR